MAGRKPKAYSVKEAGRQSGKEKTEYEGTGAGERNARLSEVAASGSNEGMGKALCKAF